MSMNLPKTLDEAIQALSKYPWYDPDSIDCPRVCELISNLEKVYNRHRSGQFAPYTDLVCDNCGHRRCICACGQDRG